MEEKKELKKTKILKILKIIKYILFSLFLIAIGLFCVKKCNALTSYENYNYQYIGQIRNKTAYDSNYYQCSFDMYAYYDNGEWIQGDNLDLNGYEDLIQIVLDTSDGLGISNANVNNNNLYMVKGIIDSVNEQYKIYAITTITIYERKLTSDLYNNGYETGLDANNESAYEQGVQQGLNQAETQSQNELQSQKNQYDQAIATLNEEIQRLEEQINGQNTNWGSYKSLLGTIFTYPIQFFKEGFNVQIFGINVGGFIVGIGMLIILITIIGFVLRGKTPGGQ